ncbi:MAG: hypothetical protein ACYCYP_00135 [Leptospirales bacterium]
MKSGWIFIVSGLLLLGGLLYGIGDLIANNAGFFEPPGASRRLEVYLSLSSAWTDPTYPLPEVAPRDYLGDPALVQKDILQGIAYFNRWKILPVSPVASAQVSIIRVGIPGSFWRAPQIMELRIAPMEYGLHLWVKSVSVSRRPDFGANRNSILRLFHAIDNQIAIHPPG